jgi:hypothetical protein
MNTTKEQFAADNGTSSSWHKSALKQKAGRIHAAGKVKEVSFEPYMAHMTGSRAKSATVKIAPSK